MQYIDGIDDFSYRDGIVRGNLVILQNSIDIENTESSDASAQGLKLKIESVGSVVMPLKAALQIHAALGELINRLLENNVIKPAELRSDTSES